MVAVIVVSLFQGFEEGLFAEMLPDSDLVAVLSSLVCSGVQGLPSSQKELHSLSFPHVKWIKSSD